MQLLSRVRALSYLELKILLSVIRIPANRYANLKLLGIDLAWMESVGRGRAYLHWLDLQFHP